MDVERIEKIANLFRSSKRIIMLEFLRENGGKIRMKDIMMFFIKDIEIGLTASEFYYHYDILKKMGLIERGKSKGVYGLTPKAYMVLDGLDEMVKG